MARRRRYEVDGEETDERLQRIESRCHGLSEGCVDCSKSLAHGDRSQPQCDRSLTSPSHELQIAHIGTKLTLECGL